MDARSSDHVVWDPVAGANDYGVELSQLSGIVDKGLVVATTNVLVSDLISGVNPPIVIGNTRRVRVRARDVLGGGDFSPYLTFNLVGLPAPLNLRIE